MFETIAALSTLAFILIFIALFQMDRAGRREEAAEQGSQSASSPQRRDA